MLCLYILDLWELDIGIRYMNIYCFISLNLSFFVFKESITIKSQFVKASVLPPSFIGKSLEMNVRVHMIYLFIIPNAQPTPSRRIASQTHEVWCCHCHCPQFLKWANFWTPGPICFIFGGKLYQSKLLCILCVCYDPTTPTSPTSLLALKWKMCITLAFFNRFSWNLVWSLWMEGLNIWIWFIKILAC